MGDKPKEYRDGITRRDFVKNTTAAGLAGAYAANLASPNEAFSVEIPSKETNPSQSDLAAQSKKVTPKGTLVLIGGKATEPIPQESDGTPPPVLNLKYYDPAGILKKAVELTGKKNPVVEIITCGSEIAATGAKFYSDAFKALGASEVHYVALDDMEVPWKNKIGKALEILQVPYIARTWAIYDSDAVAERFKKADLVFIAGGDQYVYEAAFAGTKSHENMQKEYIDRPDYVICGTSAGAMLLSSHMMRGGEKGEEHLLKTLNPGLGALCAAIDTHTDKWYRLGRVIETMKKNLKHTFEEAERFLVKDIIGIILPERTALIIKDGDATVYGKPVHIVIPRQLASQYSQYILKNHDHLLIDPHNIPEYKNPADFVIARCQDKDKFPLGDYHAFVPTDFSASKSIKPAPKPSPTVGR